MRPHHVLYLDSELILDYPSVYKRQRVKKMPLYTRYFSYLPGNYEIKMFFLWPSHQDAMAKLTAELKAMRGFLFLGIKLIELSQQ